MSLIANRTPEQLSSNVHQVSNSKFLAVLILLISFTATFALWYSYTKVEERELDSKIDTQMEQTIASISHRMQGYEEILRGGAGLFNASDDVTREEWRTYINALQIYKHYPGIQGIGYAIRTLENEKESLSKRIHSEGYPLFSINPEGERDEYYPIIYLEPLVERNLRAFGYDMFSESVRHEAMARARDTNDMAMSGKVRLVQETNERPQAGMLIYVPVYRNNAAHNTLEERRRNILGFVYSPFRMDDLMNGILGVRSSNIDLEIYNGTEISNDALMYDDTSDHSNHVAGLSRERQLSIGGIIWTIKIDALPMFTQENNKKLSSIALLVGGTLSILLAGIAWLLSNVGTRAQTLAIKMTRSRVKARERFGCFSIQ